MQKEIRISKRLLGLLAFLAAAAITAISVSLPGKASEPEPTATTAVSASGAAAWAGVDEIQSPQDDGSTRTLENWKVAVKLSQPWPPSRSAMLRRRPGSIWSTFSATRRRATRPDTP